jgi:hypothetical protein
MAAGLAAALLAGQAVHADPALGVSVSYVFGEGFAAGVKVFSTDEEEEVAGYLGVDYVFMSGQVRPNLGVAYLFDSAFLGADIGWDIQDGVANFALSGGYADTTDPTEATPAAATDSGTGGDGGTGDDGGIVEGPIDCTDPLDCDLGGAVDLETPT